MEQISLMLGIVLMLTTAIGIVLYVALVIAIPLCRLLDWLSPSPSPDQPKPALRRRASLLAWPGWLRRRRIK
ncbi:MAG: hypothetical protein AB7N65_23310 [Vicinamibacterales bacterium]